MQRKVGLDSILRFTVLGVEIKNIISTTLSRFPGQIHNPQNYVRDRSLFLQTFSIPSVRARTHGARGSIQQTATAGIIAQIY